MVGAVRGGAAAACWLISPCSFEDSAAWSVTWLSAALPETGVLACAPEPEEERLSMRIPLLLNRKNQRTNAFCIAHKKPNAPLITSGGRSHDQTGLSGSSKHRAVNRKKCHMPPNMEACGNNCQLNQPGANSSRGSSGSLGALCPSGPVLMDISGSMLPVRADNLYAPTRIFPRAVSA